MAYNYNRNRYSMPSMSTRLIESQNANARLHDELQKLEAQVKALESEVSRLERELANRG